MYLYQYFLGNHSALGWAEIRALKLFSKNKFGSNASQNINLVNQEPDAVIKFLHFFDTQYLDFKLFNTVFIVSNKNQEQLARFLDTMGGPTKLAQVVAIKSFDKTRYLDGANFTNFADFIAKIIEALGKYVSVDNGNNQKLKQDKKERINLKYTRINWYGQIDFYPDAIKKLRNFLSDYFGVPVKIIGRHSSKVVNTATTHKVIKNNGIELNITYDKQSGLLIVSKTVAVQNYKVFSVLEYRRPHRDMEIGMLPMKLALIMLNLAQLKKDMGFWDPMAGLGTLLMAGQLKGLYSYGSDINHIAVKKAQENVEWLAKTGLVNKLKYRVFCFDITKDPMSNKILRDIARFGKFDAIVTEGYLGPTRVRPFVSKKQVAIWLSKLDALYTKFLKNVSLLLNVKGKVIFTTPIYKYYDGNRKLQTVALVPPINRHRYNVIKYNTGELLWENPRSVVMRNVHILEKK